MTQGLQRRFSVKEKKKPKKSEGTENPEADEKDEQPKEDEKKDEAAATEAGDKTKEEDGKQCNN